MREHITLLVPTLSIGGVPDLAIKPDGGVAATCRPETIVATYRPEEALETEPPIETEFEIAILRTGVKISDGWDSALIAWENVPEAIKFFKDNEKELLKKCESI